MSIESWRDGYQRGFLDGLEIRKKWDEENLINDPNEWNEQDDIVRQRLKNLTKMRDEWDEDYYDYYHAGMVTRPFEKTFDDVAFPDKCQECDGNCKVC